MYFYLGALWQKWIWLFGNAEDSVHYNAYQNTHRSAVFIVISFGRAQLTFSIESLPFVQKIVTIVKNRSKSKPHLVSVKVSGQIESIAMTI